MKARLFALLSLTVALVLLLPGGLRPLSAQPQPASSSAPATPSRAQAVAGLQNAPMMFIENAGQFDARAHFQVRGGNGTLWLTDDALWFTLLERPASPASLPEKEEGGREVRGVNLKLSFVGANPHPRLEPFRRLDTHVSYFMGNDPARWRANVPVWGGVRYVDLYPGIDLELSGGGGVWQPRLAAHAGADLSLVRLRIEGAEALALQGSRVQISTALGAYALPLLLVTSSDGGAVPAWGQGPAVRGNEVTAPFGPGEDVAVSQPAGPTDIVYSTFLGGSGDDYGRHITVDASGAAYITGFTSSTDFPTTPGAFQTTLAGGTFDGFVTKLNAAGNALIYSTFLGGTGVDAPYGIMVDATGTAYVAGRTSSTDFPITPGAVQTVYGLGPYDGFVTKLNADGSTLVYSTYLGGHSSDGAIGGIAVDANGNAFVTGFTSSVDFPTTPGAFQTTYATGTCGIPPNDYPCPDAFVTKLNADGSGLVYSTYLGGPVDDYAQGIAVDGTGAAYVAGSTSSATFPTTPGAFDTTYSGGLDGFVTKLAADGSGLVYSTFLGGSANDNAYSIAVDTSGMAFVSGYTQSLDFPTTAGALQTTYGGGDFDAFVTKLNADGSSPVYSTFLGGISNDVSYAIGIDGGGLAYVSGFTSSTNFPITSGAFQESCGGCPTYSDAFVTQLNVNGTGLFYSSFLGGSNSDYGNDLTLDPAGAAYIAGWTYSSDFPTTAGAFQTTYAGGLSDGFATKLVLISTPYHIYLPVIVNNP